MTRRTEVMLVDHHEYNTVVDLHLIHSRNLMSTIFTEILKA